MPTGAPPEIVFGPYRLDRQRRSLTRDGAPVQLGGRAFDTLALLAAAGGETVPKQALLDQVWPGLAVEENNLQVQVSTLRKALGAGWIVNVPGRGYRLAPPPGLQGPEPAEAAEGIAGIAVLPFQNMSGDPEQEYFADGMAEEITTALSRVRSLLVIARQSSFTFKGRVTDVRQVGRELGVRYVLEGSVRKAGRRLRITAELADATDGAQLWADRFDGQIEDVFDLQDRVTVSVVGAIEPRIRAVEIRRAQRKPPESLQAYDLLLRAQPLAYRMQEADNAEARRLLRRAVDIDPGYAPAFAQLAACHWFDISQGWTQDIVLATTEIKKLAQLALETGRDDPEVLASISHRIALPGGDLDGGIALAEQALALNPNSPRR